MRAVDNITRVYDSSMRKLAYLENGHNVGYELKHNELWSAQFTLPANDKKNIYCQPFNYVEIFDAGERIELFRIMPSKLTRNEQGDIVYTCEHVLATLMDDVLFQYHQVGNDGVGTVPVLRYILDRQEVPRWQLKVCDFDKYFEYKWENENLLAALFSVPLTFNEDYRWEFDTRGSIWYLSLKRLSSQFVADIIYRKNMTEITKEVDPTTVVTRLYCLGYGEGDNQLTISSVNNGVPYLEANVATYGLKKSILVDRRFESAEALKAYGQTLLNELKNPFKSYTAKAIDLYRKSPEKYARYFPGDIVKVVDKEDNITEYLPIALVSKADITGAPGDVIVEIAKKSRDIASSITSLQDRTRINEVYAQGATNQIIVPFIDNADPTYPAIMRFHIPESMARINKCILNYQLEAFRAYSKAVGGGGGSSRSTKGGGGVIKSSGDGGQYGISSEGGGQRSMSSEGGGQRSMSSEGGGATSKTSYYQFIAMSEISENDQTDLRGDHNHGISDGTALRRADGGIVYFYESGIHDHNQYRHAHDVYFPEHTHPIYLPSHTHPIYLPSHTHPIYLPSHTHPIYLDDHFHVVELVDHIHNLEFGIYQGTTADSVTIKVDGTTIPTTQPGTDINIVPYLSVDSDGKIQRNAWHTVEITPNKMTRVAANIFMQIFTNSRGGGDY